MELKRLDDGEVEVGLSLMFEKDPMFGITIYGKTYYTVSDQIMTKDHRKAWKNN